MSSATKTRQMTRITLWPFSAFLLILMVAGSARAQSAAAVSGLEQESAVSAAAKSDPELKAIASEIQCGKYASAESDARASVQRQPDSPVMHNLLGYVLYRENKPKESLAEYTAGARYGKPCANDLAVVAMDYILLADYPDADKWLTVATGVATRKGSLLVLSGPDEVPRKPLSRSGQRFPSHPRAQTERYSLPIQSGSGLCGPGPRHRC